MAISYLGAGTRSVAVNANTTPALPAASFQDGDLLVVLDTCHRDRTTSVPATPGTPSGWTRKDTWTVQGSVRSMRGTWFYKPWVSGDTAPTFTYGPTGVTDDEHTSQMIGLRGALTGADPTMDLGGTPTEQASSSTVLGPVSGVTGSRDGGIVLVAGLREANATTISTLSGDSLTWTEIDEYHGTTGTNLYSRAWDYALVPTASAVTSKSFTITAGSAAPSAGQMWLVGPPGPSGLLWRRVMGPLLAR